ncbi:transcription initiation factor TFIID subunit 8 [Danio rerio]|uniref:Isoform 2 of Transcription initiation factor TFIID subunit 8 n=1 Tax=Danio rerio TaxID=7955 RepID=Q6P0T2-2|nr:transcription initiation factor TFIID subunit 8 [Danio rerio]AAH49422.1 TAF8 RNA polymerase II, TATA box binding protein (TBP)-associated factor [Danio rerio]|eukprot:NP_956580.1 transcription initiation factor TFIID subunit 8 [Danio rerio]
MADSVMMGSGSLNSGSRSGSSKTCTSPTENYQLARRRTLQVVVSALLTECGFDSAEKAVVETLTEMMQSYITEVGRCAKANCEHTARSTPTLSDVVITLVEMGFNVDTLPVYAKRSQRMVITAPPITNAPVVPKSLTAGQKRTHPAHIPSHFPDFPDPHTYIRTPTFREPVSDYQVVREKAASQRRDVERALTRFMAKTGETQSLFKDDQMDNDNNTSHIMQDDSGADKENEVLPPGGVVPSGKANEENMIDNPYLRPVKKPKVRRKK